MNLLLLTVPSIVIVLFCIAFVIVSYCFRYWPSHPSHLKAISPVTGQTPCVSVSPLYLNPIYFTDFGNGIFLQSWQKLCWSILNYFRANSGHSGQLSKSWEQFGPKLPHLGMCFQFLLFSSSHPCFHRVALLKCCVDLTWPQILASNCDLNMR